MENAESIIGSRVYNKEALALGGGTVSGLCAYARTYTQQYHRGGMRTHNIHSCEALVHAQCLNEIYVYKVNLYNLIRARI